MIGSGNRRRSFLAVLMEPWGGETATSEEGIRYQFFTVLILLGLPTLLGFGVVHMRRGDLIPSLWDLVLICGGASGWIYYRLTGRWRVVFRANFILLLGLFFYLLLTGGEGGSRSLFMLTLPLIVMLNLGRREGLIWAAVCILLSTSAMLAASEVPWVYDYSVGFKLRFLTVLIFSSALAVWYETSRQNYREGMAEKHRRLEGEIEERKRVERDRERIIQKLQAALAEVKALSGLIPICANCHSIRDDTGYWNRLEKFIQDRSDARFSHDICPECVAKLDPEGVE